MTKLFKRAVTYMGKNVAFNSLTHLIGGIGIGMLLTYPLAGAHPVRWGLVFIAVALAGHWWAATH
ncbi:hypothetical protein M1555_00940 [Patescibacteria group bacterium]|nr:hypothetical protein [Patescibacteria group bacterium]